MIKLVKEQSEFRPNYIVGRFLFYVLLFMFLSVILDCIVKIALKSPYEIEKKNETMIFTI